MSAETLASPADQNRRLESAIRLGTIAEVRYDPPAVRVLSGGLKTGWLPWFESRAGTTRDWDPPTPGEQCIILSPSGETASGIVLLGIPSDLIKPPSQEKSKQVREWPDNARFEYDHEAHEWQLEVPSSGAIRFKIGQTTLLLKSSGVTLTTPEFSGVKA